MKLEVSCSLNFDIQTATPFILMLRPRSGAQQWVAREEFTLAPEVQVHQFTDGFGNYCQRLLAPVGRFSIRTAAAVYTSDRMDRSKGAPFVEVQNLPDDILQYLLPSRYCEAEHFGQLAAEITKDQVPGYNQVSAIENWIRNEIHYSYEDSGAIASADEVVSRKSGVCRDFAHLGIALCRSLVIPARIVVGYRYQLQPMDMHAWFEAYVADRWYTFDPTQKDLKSGYVMLGIGRDAADVALYNQFGPPIAPTDQQVRVERLSENS